MRRFCENCGVYHVTMDEIVVEEIDIRSYELISIRLDCSTQAAKITTIPDDQPAEKISAYIQGCINAKADAEYLMRDWWRDATKKYNLPEGISYDSINNKFTYNEDKDGNRVLRCNKR